MARFNQMRAFFGQLDQGRKQTEQPTSNAAVIGSQAYTDAQNIRAGEEQKEVKQVQDRKVTDYSGTVTQPTFGNVKAPEPTAASTQPVSFGTKDEDIVKQAAEQTTKAGANLREAGAAATSEVQDKLAELYDVSDQELADIAARAETIGNVGGKSPFEAQQESLLQEAAYGDPTSNVGLLSNMYYIDPRIQGAAALESNIRQGEVNQLRADAEAALSAEERARGGRDTLKQFYGAAMDTTKAEEEKAREQATKDQEEFAKRIDTEAKALEDRYEEVLDNLNTQKQESVDNALNTLNEISTNSDVMGVSAYLGENGIPVNDEALTPQQRDAIAANAGRSKVLGSMVEGYLAQGMSPEAVRQQFASMGYPPELADRIIQNPKKFRDDMEALSKNIIKDEYIDTTPARVIDKTEKTTPANAFRRNIAKPIYDASFVPGEWVAEAVGEGDAYRNARDDVYDATSKGLTQAADFAINKPAKKLKKFFGF